MQADADYCGHYIVFVVDLLAEDPVLSSALCSRVGI